MKPINLSGRPGLLSIALGLSLLLPTTGAAAYQDTPSTALPIQVPQSPIDVALTGADVAQLLSLIHI